MDKKDRDDFQWVTYTNDYYIKQINQMQKEGIEFVLKQSYVDNNKIIFDKNIHPFAKELYNEILHYKPNSVFECGCGPGHHLYNIKKLFPETEISGCELLETQLKQGSKKLNIPLSITDNIKIIDFCNFIIDKRYEFVYTNAVIMHLCYDKAYLFIKKIKEISSKYIRLYEDIGQHDFMELFNNTGIINEFEIQKKSNGYFLKRKE